MSNMYNVPIDNYSEHFAGFHNTYQENCSECFKENRIIKARSTVNRDSMAQRLGYENVSDMNRSIISPRDGSSPWDRNPLED